MSEEESRDDIIEIFNNEEPVKEEPINEKLKKKLKKKKLNLKQNQNQNQEPNQILKS